MIDPTRDNIYNIILSLFLGVVVVLGLHFIHESPRTITIKSDRTEPFDSESKCF